MVPFAFLPGTGFPLARVVPERWRKLRLSDRDEKNKIVGRAREGVLALFVCVGGPPGCHEQETLTHHTFVQETLPKANLPPTSRTSKCRAPGCNPPPLLWNRECQSRFGSPSDFVVCRMVCLFRRERERSPIMCKEAPLSTVFILSFDFMIGLGLDVFIFVDRRAALEEFCFVHVCECAFLSTLCVLPDLLHALSNQRLKPPSPESWILVFPNSFLYDVTTGIRLMKVSDIHVVS